MLGIARVTSDQLASIWEQGGPDAQSLALFSARSPIQAGDHPSFHFGGPRKAFVPSNFWRRRRHHFPECPFFSVKDVAAARLSRFRPSGHSHTLPPHPHFLAPSQRTMPPPTSTSLHTGKQRLFLPSCCLTNPPMKGVFFPLHGFISSFPSVSGLPCCVRPYYREYT